ncbi:MAG: hypothetical protein SGPRY_010689, partial [Prymnesium sp.]
MSECAAALSLWCSLHCPHAAHTRLVALFDRSARSEARAWRCYAPSTLDPSHTRYVAGELYCTRHDALQMELESLRPLVVEVPSFLAPEECEALIKATSRQRDEGGCEECGTWWLSRANANRADAQLIASVEERLSSLVGMATHEGENVIKITVRNGIFSYQPTTSRSSYNLHHEKIGRPRRVATILVYLTTPSKGGHTIFPAASFNATTVHSFLEITPPRGEYWRVDENAEVSRGGSVGLRSVDATAHVRAAQAAADATCFNPLEPGAGVAVQPQRGKA